MFAAIGRLFKAMMYAFTGRFDKMTEVWNSKGVVIRATYDGIENKHRARIGETKNAVAGLMRFKVQKERRLEEVGNDLEKYGKLMRGAQSKAQHRADALGGAENIEVIRGDAAYMTCLNAFKDFKSTSEAKQSEAASLEEELTSMEEKLDEYKVMLQDMMRELGNIRREKEETVADVEIAKQQREVADLMTGISTDKTSEDRRRLQELRGKIKADADISQQLAGIDEKKAEKDFMAFAEADVANDEFESLLGLAVTKTETATADESVSVSDGSRKLPEA